MHYESKDVLGRENAGEPSVGTDWKTGRTLYMAGTQVSRVTYDSSQKPPKPNWTDVPVEALSLGHARLVELARALITDPELLLLDEPSSGLDRVEALALAAVLRSTQEQKGTAVLLVEHDLEMVQRVVSRLFVLDSGAVLASGACADVLGDERVRHAYLGRGVAS